MVFEKSIKVGDGGKLTLNTNTCLVRETNLVSTAVAYEDSVLSHLTSILESDQHSVVISSAKYVYELSDHATRSVFHVPFFTGFCAKLLPILYRRYRC